MAGNTISILQSVKDNDSELDYNHLTVAGNKVYVAGSSKKDGGLVAAISLDGTGNLNTADAKVSYVDKDAAKHEGYDANCVTTYGDNVVVATTRGYDVFDKDFATHFYQPTSGKAKHLAVANNNIYGLNFTSGTNAQIQKFDNASLTNATAFSVGNVAPDYAKNVIAVDGTDVYVCKGQNGVARYDANGNETWSWSVPTMKNPKDRDKLGLAKGYANGLAVDGQYVYVACGGYGVVVLNKATGKEICHRQSQTGKSANYVAVDGTGNIYVAYGQSRIQVFKVTATK